MGNTQKNTPVDIQVEGCFVDLMAGIYHINVLEPKCWDDGSETDDVGAPEPFRKSTRLAQHVSFLKDFFRAYKDFNDGHIDIQMKTAPRSQRSPSCLAFMSSYLG